MKKLYLLAIVLFTSIVTFAQTPNQFKYQAVLRDGSGNVLANENVTVDISILQSDLTTSVFEETHTTQTTSQGLINLNIGSNQDLNGIDWSADEYFFEITVNGTVMGTSQLLSVPYALHSKTAETVLNDEVEDADADPENELQELSFTGTELSISNGNNVDLSSLQDGTGTDDQTITFSGTMLEIENGNSVDLSSLQGGLATDDQNLMLSGNTLSIEDGNSVDLSGYVNTDNQDLTLSGTTLQITNGTSADLSSLQDGTGTDDQSLTLSGNTLSIEDGNNVDLSGYVNTDNQDLTLSGTTLQITNGTSADLSSLQDGTGTDDQNLTLSSNTLSIEDGNSVNLSGYLDNTDNQTLSLSGENLSIIGGNTVTLPNKTLIVDNDTDTKVEVERNADEDIIRFSNAGTETMTFDGQTLEFYNNGASVFIGNMAGEDDDGSNNENVFVGYGSGHENTIGSYNAYYGAYTGHTGLTGTRNTFLGYKAGRTNSGTGNSYIGCFSGDFNASGSGNVFLGYATGYLNSAGSNNVFIGNMAGYNETGSNMLYIDNSNTSTPLIYGEFNNDLLRINGQLQINNEYSLPTTDGANGQVMQTDGNGNISWATIASGSTTWSLSGSNAYYNSGSVGVGTSAPQTNLHLYENVNTTTPIFSIEQANTTGDASMRFTTNGGNTYTIGIDASNSDNFTISDNASLGSNDRFVITSSGNIGVGTSSPTYKFQVNGDLYATTVRGSGYYLSGLNADNITSGTLVTSRIQNGSYMISSAGTNGQVWTSDGDGAGYWASSSGSSLWSQSGTSVYYNSGSIGVGTTSPGANFEIYENSTSTAPQFEISQANSSGDASMSFTVNTSNVYSIGVDASDGNKFKISDNPYVGDGDRLTITPTGNIGINSANPLHSLLVSGNITDITGVDGNFIDIQNTNSSIEVMSGIRFQNGTTANTYKGAIFYQDKEGYGRGDIIFANNNVNASGDVSVADAVMTLKNNGDIGVGTSSPTDKLHVAGDVRVGAYSSSGPNLILGDDKYGFSASNWITHFYGSRNGTTDQGGFSFNIWNGASWDMNRVVIKADGDLGIGTDNPAAKLDVQGTVYFEGSDGDIDNDGDVDIQDFSSFMSAWGDPTLTNEEIAEHDINGDGVFSYDDVYLVSSIYAGNSKNQALADANFFYGLNYNGGNTFFEVSGAILPYSDNLYDLGSSTKRWDDVYATNGVIQTSDIRLKTDIVNSNYGLNEVMKMRPVEYYWISNKDKGNQLGFIAQEIQIIVPEVVNVGDDENQTLGIHYDKLVPVLVNAIQEQQEQIEELQKKNELLENQVNANNNLKAELDIIKEQVNLLQNQINQNSDKNNVSLTNK